ncbi:MAG: hypothetical protein P4L56_22425 [Candidatus Sulfopaludibacter sp.]|nr:hypothetical protein [Candidatus Sulfopaludibacter sp.]
MKKSCFILSLIAGFAAAASLHAQTLSVDQSQLSFSALVGSNTALTQTITVSSSPSGANFNAFASQQVVTTPIWLRMANVTPPSYQTAVSGTTGQPSAVVTVLANPAGLSAGTYTGTIIINSTSSNSSVSVQVTFSVGNIGVSPQNLAFTYQSGGTLPASQQLMLSGSGSFTIANTSPSGANWLIFTPTGGTLPTTSAVTVGVDPTVTPALTAGTYNGQITITPTPGTPINIAVTLTVASAPSVTATPNPINLYYQIGGAVTASQTLTLASTQQLTFAVTPSQSWIAVTPSNGTICLQAGTGCTAPAAGTAQVTVSYNNTANLVQGTYSGYVTVFASGAVPALQNIPVNLTVSNLPLLIVPSAPLSFNYNQVTAQLPATQPLTVASSAVPVTAPVSQQVPIFYNVIQGNNWLFVTPPTGVAPNQVYTGMQLTISVNPAGLALGSYTGTIQISGNGFANSPQTVQVNLVVSNNPSILTNGSATPAPLFFESQIGQPAVATAQTSQTLTISSSTGATLNYTAVAATQTGNWLQLNSTSGSTNGTITVTTSAAGLAANTYTGNITITATNPATGSPALGSPFVIPVTLYVDSNPMLVVTPPAPLFLASPVNGATVQQNLSLYSTNPGSALNYSVAISPANTNWLFLSQSAGTTQQGGSSLTLYANTALLAAGTYTANLVITATGTNAVVNSPVTIPITFTITSGVLSLSQTSLSFSQATGGVAPAAGTVQVTSSGQPIGFTAIASGISGNVTWLSVTPSAGSTTPGSISVTVDGSKLPPGNYTGTVTVSAPNATSATLQVNLAVSAGTITATPSTTLTFNQVAGGTAPAAQTISVTGTPGALNFTVATAMTNGTGWLSAVVAGGTSTGGATPATVNVSVSAGNLPVGKYNGTVTIASSGATGSPISIPVVMNVVTPQTLSFSSTTPLNFNYTIGVTPTPLTQTVSLTSSASAQFSTSAATNDKSAWLSVTPATGTATSTPTNLTVSVTPTGLTAGTYSGTVTVTSPSSLQPQTLQVTLTVVAVTPPTLTAIKNSASYATGAVAPGELVLIGGTNVGPATLTYGTVTGTQLSTNVASTQVLFDNVPAPIWYATATQTAVFVPYEVAGRPTTSVTVITQGATSPAFTYNVTTAQPGIFTQNSQGSGPGSILNQDYSVNGPTNGAAGGSAIVVYMTGEGQTSPAGVTGAVIPSNGTGLKTPIQTVTASIGGVPLPASAILYAGSAPGDASGVLQVNLLVPSGLTPGPQPIVVSVGGIPSQAGVTVQVK